MEAGFDDVFDAVGGEGGIEIETIEDAGEDEDEDEDEGIEETSGIIQLVTRIITESERLGASDIHIEPGKDDAPGAVRIRVDGICRELLKVPKEHCAAMIARVKVISRLNIAEKRLPQDGKCKLKVRGQASGASCRHRAHCTR